MLVISTSWENTKCHNSKIRKSKVGLVVIALDSQSRGPCLKPLGSALMYSASLPEVFRFWDFA